VPDVLGMLDGNGSPSPSVPASFLSNDLIMPSAVYPSIGNPMCPNDGWNGYTHMAGCNDGPWEYAQLGYVVGSAMPSLMMDYDAIQSSTWGWGVFYATDANAVDSRCFWADGYKGYDCPQHWIQWGESAFWDADKLGAGHRFPGNPWSVGTWGGGAGCHFANYNGDAGIDQTDAAGDNLVGDQSCQCNYNLKGNGWTDWVRQWVDHATPKKASSWQGWLGPHGGKAPAFAVDFAACWVNNPRDMIGLANAVYAFRERWSNQLFPKSNWQDSDPASQRVYWGWNEVPVSRKAMDNPGNWDAIFLKLPAAICGHDGSDDSVQCLSASGQQALESELERFRKSGVLRTGAAYASRRPGSSVAFLKEQRVGGARWMRTFYCENWSGPTRNQQGLPKWQVVYVPQTGACYVQANWF